MIRTQKNASWQIIFVLFLFSYCQATADNDLNQEWFILGPIPVSKDTSQPSETQQKAAFEMIQLAPETITQVKEGQTQKINNDIYTWQSVREKDQMIDLDKLFENKDFAYAYAWSEFEAEETIDLILGVGSDDAVSVWLNGKLVHEHWIPRGLVKDSDLIPVTLKKGKNQVLLKIQDMQQDWAFSCRILPPEVYSDKLIEAAKNGQKDQMELLITYGAELNATNTIGLTALQAAKIKGREEIVQMLLQHGADSERKLPAKESMADALFENAIGIDEPGAAVLLAKDGKITYQKGFGLANVNKEDQITPETHFRIGSITKQFTASAILKLQEQGKLKLTDRLSQYIADYPRGDEVTIHHLLTHTSGIKSYTDKINFEDQEVTKPIQSIESHIESFKNDPYNFDPGESWSYNNSGYFLLGYIVEKVSGKSYESYLQDCFFNPLNMQNTGVHHEKINLNNEALGYSYQNGSFELAPNWEMSWAGGAGALYSTVGDLHKWNEGIFNGEVLSQESLQKAFKPVLLNDSMEAQPKYGYGWMIGEFRGWKDVSHGGGLPGFVTYLTRFPEQNVTVAVLTNTAPPKEVNPQQYAYDLAEIYFWEEMEAQESYAVDANADTDSFKDYAGRYEYPGGAILTVSVEDNRLFAQLTGQPNYEIFPKGEEVFFWKVTEAQVQFIRNESGAVIKAAHTQGGRTFEAPKLADEKAVSVEASILENYVGDYDMNGNNVSISLQNKQLFIQVAGQPKFEMYARSDNEFFLKVVKADITFNVKEDGNVDKLILKQAGMQHTLPRKE